MDVVRSRRKTARLPFVLVALAGAGLIAASVWALPSLLRRTAGGDEPFVERDALVIDTVTRGTLVRSIRAAGILVPDRIHVVATVADGIVTDVAVRAGSRVTADTTVARLDNPELGVAVADASARLIAARADVRSAQAEARATRLDAETALRSARAEDARATVEARADSALHARGLIGDLQYRAALIKSAEDRDLLAIARSKIAVDGADADSKIAAAQARAAEIAAELEAKRAQLATLDVRAGAPGIVQDVAVDSGQRVTGGAEFARIASDRDLKAVLQVPEADVRGIVAGLPVRVTASEAGTATGRVARIAPAAQNGSVAVDVTLTQLPPAVRPDQNVDGTIVLARIAGALSLARPANANEAGRFTLYRVDRDASHAYRTAVTLGAGSEDRARVLDGLAAGDRAIVSDTTAYSAPILRIR